MSFTSKSLRDPGGSTTGCNDFCQTSCVSAAVRLFAGICVIDCGSARVLYWALSSTSKANFHRSASAAPVHIYRISTSCSCFSPTWSLPELEETPVRVDALTQQFEPCGEPVNVSLSIVSSLLGALSDFWYYINFISQTKYHPINYCSWSDEIGYHIYDFINKQIRSSRSGTVRAPLSHGGPVVPWFYLIRMENLGKRF